jgi:hypothetical protein
VSDGGIASDRPTVIFFGTAHCWNTNREAERFVALYRKHRDGARFVVVDLSNPSGGAKAADREALQGLHPDSRLPRPQGDRRIRPRRGDCARAGRRVRAGRDPAPRERRFGSLERLRTLNPPPTLVGSPSRTFLR